nr:hypothetical protein [Chroococcidiopsis sp. CCALA 051]
MSSLSVGRGYTWACIIKRDILAGWTASIAWAVGVSWVIRPWRRRNLSQEANN